MDKSLQLLPLFATPLIKSRIDFNIDREYLDSLKYRQYSDSSGLISTNEKILLEDEFSELKTEIEDRLNKFLFDILQFNEGTIAHTRSWINLHMPGCYAGTHNHTNACYSGIYYIDVPENGGAIWFVGNGEPTYSTNTVVPSLKSYNIHNCKEFPVDAKANDLLLFPSHLHHRVDINQSNQRRYSLAFNYFLEGEIGGSSPINITVL